MKKAAAAGALLLLMLGLSVWNSHALDARIREIGSHTRLCREYCRQERLEPAEEELSAAALLWDREGTYAHIFLRQTETDAVEADFSDALERLRSGDAAAAEVVLRRLERRLEAMAAMERISWESVL